MAKAQTISPGTSEELLWKDGQFWQNLMQMIAFPGLAICCFIFFSRIY